MNKIDTYKRSNNPEILDGFQLQGNELEHTLKDIDKVNVWLGGNNVTINGIESILNKVSKKGKISILDAGCGNGNILRKVAEYGRKKDLNLELLGIDGNPFAIEIAKKSSAQYPEIRFKTMDLFSQEFKKLNMDVVLCTLTLHHFKDTQIIELLALFINSAKFGVVINDLHRSKMAYRLFQLFCMVFIRNEIARKDGLTSILRGFKKKELKKYAEIFPDVTHEINWRWAFRYEWIIRKGNAQDVGRKT